MTADELQRIVINLANTGWCRYWREWPRRSDQPWLMAIQVYGRRFYPFTGLSVFEPVRIEALESRGFAMDHATGNGDPTTAYIYTVARTNDDGTPYQ